MFEGPGLYSEVTDRSAAVSSNCPVFWQGQLLQRDYGEPESWIQCWASWLAFTVESIFSLNVPFGVPLHVLVQTDSGQQLQRDIETSGI